MNERRDVPGSAADADQEPSQTPRPPLLAGVTLVLFAEGAALVCATAWLVFELLTIRPVSLATAVAFLVMCAIAAFWVLATAVGALRARPWIRGSGITWQVIQVAIGVSSVEAAGSRLVGVLLLVVAAIGIALLLSPSVARATAHRAVA